MRSAPIRKSFFFASIAASSKNENPMKERRNDMVSVYIEHGHLLVSSGVPSILMFDPCALPVAMARSFI